MRRWLFMLGGLAVWAAHFLGVYMIASVAAVVSRADAPAALWAVGGYTLACGAADLGIAAMGFRRWRTAEDSLDRFIDMTATVGAGISLVAVIWQGAPALVGH